MMEFKLSRESYFIRQMVRAFERDGRMIKRAILRGKPLDNDCKRANTTWHEYGMNDKRIFCYGLYTEMSDCEIQEKCWQCGAFVDNAKPLAELGGKA